MKKSSRSLRKNLCSNRIGFERLENRNLLAADMLPDLFAWASEERGYLHDYHVEGNLLRFTTAFANQGEGHLEVFGGEVLESGNQEVWQRIYDNEGGHRDQLAGEFTYHPGHGHIHYDGYASYNLRSLGPAGEVGNVVATGGKISFCLIDITRFDARAGSSSYGSCGTTQGVSAGWSDVYGSGLADQWVNIAGVEDGDYFLEINVDPDEQLEESDETNNTTFIEVTIDRGFANNGDRFELNDSFTSAEIFGMTSERHEGGLSIHDGQDVDYYQFSSVDHGEFEIHVNFSHALGNIDAFVYDENFDLIASGDSVDDLEDLHFHTHPNQPYYLEIVGVDGATNGYDLELVGPGDIVAATVMSENVPASISDRTSPVVPGQRLISTLEGPDITLTDTNLILEELRHTFLGDLSFDLTSPSGTTVKVLRAANESPSGPLQGQEDFIDTVLDDQAATNIGDDVASFAGSYNVNFGDISNPFEVFDNESALGTWRLSITDWSAGDTGVLHSWGLMFAGIDNNPGDLLEQNDAFPQATDLGTIGTVNLTELSIHTTNDVDFFRFNAVDDSNVQIDMSYLHGDGNIDLVVYDSNQQEIVRADTINDDESLSFPVVAGELYYIEVYGVDGARNDYELSLDIPRLASHECDFVGGDDGCGISDLDALYTGANGAPPLTDAAIDAWLAQASAIDNPAKIDPSHTYVRGDIDLDGDVDSTDLGILLNSFGNDSGPTWGRGNLNSDAVVNSTDLGILLNNFNYTSQPASATVASASPNDGGILVDADDLYTDQDEDEEEGEQLMDRVLNSDGVDSL